MEYEDHTVSTDTRNSDEAELAKGSNAEMPHQSPQLEGGDQPAAQGRIDEDVEESFIHLTSGASPNSRTGEASLSQESSDVQRVKASGAQGALAHHESETGIGRDTIIESRDKNSKKKKNCKVM